MSEPEKKRYLVSLFIPVEVEATDQFDAMQMATVRAARGEFDEKFRDECEVVISGVERVEEDED